LPEEEILPLDSVEDCALRVLLVIRVTTGPGKSWKVLEFRKTIFQARKVTENSKGRGKSWKISIMSWISWDFYNCTEKFCNVILLTVITGLLTDEFPTGIINICIHKSCIVYLENMLCW